jgi:surface antigen
VDSVFLYKGSPDARLCGRLLTVATVLAFVSGGCSYQLGSLLGTNDAKPEVTGAVSRQGLDLPPGVGMTGENEGDLVYARAAAAEVLSKGGTTASAAWENPQTGARGTVQPLAAAYVEAGVTCRDFLASYVRSGKESWMQGDGCQIHKGRWEVRNLKPWKKS